MKSATARSVRGFRGLIGDHRWQSLLSLGVQRVYVPGTMLLRQGDTGSAVTILVSGRVKVFTTEPDGEELLTALRGAGDLIGEFAAHADSTRTATVQAIDRCTAWVVPAARFDGFLDSHGVRGLLTGYVVAKTRQTGSYQVQLVHFSPERKIARLLLEVFSLADESTVDPARVPFSQRQVATALGMARSTVAHHLQHLKDIGALRAGPRLAVADTAVLKNVAGV